MAADWIPIRVGLIEDPDVIAIAAALEVNEYEAVGMLSRFWGWADQNTPNGHAACVTKVWLDRYIGVTGFADALESRGWLEVVASGIQVPNFDRYLGKGGKKRLQDARRQKTSREKSRNSHAGTVTNCVTTEQNRTEQLKDLPNGKSLGAKSRKPTQGELQSAEALYQAYPRHIAKPKALEAIAKALRRVPFDDLMAAVTEYARSRHGKDANLTPYPASWFNAERWNDDRADWFRAERPKPGERPPDAWRDFQEPPPGDGPRPF